MTTRKHSMSRFIATILVMVMLLSAVPVFAFDDEDQYANVAHFEQTLNAQLVTDNKYLKLQEADTNVRLAEGHFGEQPEQSSPIIPDGREFILEFLQEQTQDIRLELWDETDSTYLGLIAFGTAEGQWGVLHGEQWYKPNPVEGSQKPIANFVRWDGRYWDIAQQAFVFPGQNGDQPPEKKDYTFHIAFQPTDADTQQYRTVIKVTISYTEEAISDNQLLRSLYGLDCDADPVSMISGNFTWDYTDLEVFGAQPLDFTRYYNALDENETELGFGWRHNYLYSIKTSNNFATISMPNGNQMVYNIMGDESMIGPEGITYKLEKSGDGYLLTDQQQTRFFFNGEGLLIATEDIGGNRTEIARNGAEIQSISNKTGTLTFTYASGKISQIADQTGRHVNYLYDGNNDLVSFKNADNTTVDYQYENHRITEISDFNGNTYLKNTYDTLGRVTEQFMAEQGTSYFAYDYDNRVSTITDPDGSVRKYYYDTTQNVTAVEDVNGQVRYAYVDGQISKTTDRLGNSTSYTYDPEGNKTAITYPDGTTEQFEYNSLNLVTRATAKDGTITRYTYDERGNLISYTDARNNTSTYAYDGDSNMISSTDALGNATSFTYDSRGNCLTQTDPLLNVTTFEYDGQGRLVKQINPDQSMVIYEYTEAGKLVKTIDPAGKESSLLVSGNGYDTGNTDPMGFSTSTVYNQQNKPISVTDAMGNTTTYAYDSVGQLISTSDALGHTSAYQYDLGGRMIAMTDARGNAWRYNYDAEGRMTSATDPLGNSTSTVFDAMGRTTASTNARSATTSQTYDPMSRSTNISDALEKVSRNVYDNNGNLVEQYDNNGNKWSYTYDANNRMMAAIDPLGYQTTYVYDANGQSTKTVSALNAQNHSVYDSMGRLIQSVDAEGNTTIYTYDILGRLVKSTFADGTTNQNEYNDNGWLTKSIAQDGGETSYTYNANGQMLTITDALGFVSSNVYDALGRTVSVTDTLGGSVIYTYDQNGNLLTTTDAMGYVTTTAYDALNRVTTMTDPLGGVTATEYDAEGNVSKFTNADGGIFTYTYDLLDRLTSYVDTEGYTWRFTYDANGNTLTSTDGRGNTTSTVYDGLNRATSNTDAEGGVSTVAFDADGRMIQSVNPENAKTYYEYDLNGNVVKVTDALGHATAFTYDSMNRVVTMTDALGAVTAYAYTATGKVATVTDALGFVSTSEYDLLGRITRETNELGHATQYTYDALGRVLSVKNPLGNVDSFTYDANGRITTVTDKNGNITRYVYDANGNIIETIDALEHSSYFAYDAMNRLVKVTLNRLDTQDNVNENQITLYSYDHRGLVTKEINAAGNQTIYIYDGNGNLVQKTDADGYVTDFGYDARDLVDAINYTGGKMATFQYNKNGELVKMVDWNGTTSFALDLLGQITAANDHNDKTTGYTYDAVGNQTSITYPDSSVATYSYDLLRRLTNLKDHENQNTVYAYDAASQLISQAYPNGWFEEHEYDAAGQLLKTWDIDPSAKTNKTLKFGYVYDPQGNMLTNDRRGTGEGQVKEKFAYTYDALNRLTQTKGWFGKTQYDYTYDSLGNLTFEKSANTTNTKSSDYKYNILNQQIKQIVDGKDSYSYTFDKRGNLVKGVFDKKNTISEQYVYDATNRMVKGVNESAEESHYIYNGLGYLIANEWIVANNAYGYHGFAFDPSEQVNGVVVCDKHGKAEGQGHLNPSHNGGTEGGVVPKGSNKVMSIHKDYVLDYTSPLKNVIMEEESGTGGLDYRYVYGLEKVSVVISPIETSAGGLVTADNEVKLYYHQDRLGSTDFLTDNVAGKVTSYIDYDEWGAPVKKAILKMGVRELDLVTEYTGHPYDNVLGLYFAEARMYDAADRRFVAMDPIKDGLNWYAYVENNPIQYVDLTGLAPALVSGGMISVGSNKISNVYFDKATGKIYVDFFEAITAYGASSSSTTTYGNSVQTGSIFSSYGTLRADYSLNSVTGQISYSVYEKWTNAGNSYWKYASSGGDSPLYITTQKKYLVEFPYFQKLMGCVDWDEGKAVKFNEKIAVLLNGHKQYVTDKMMSDFGWPVSVEELVTINDMLYRYSITDMRSIRLFMATCGHESDKGRIKLEEGSESYFRGNGYTKNTRGAGYIQITQTKDDDAHTAFLAYVGDNFSGADTATYIANNYPWEAAAWEWAIRAKTPQKNLNSYVSKYGDGKGVFLITQYYINGFTANIPQDTASKIRDGKIAWEIKNNVLSVNALNYSAPNNWADREKSYNESKQSFK